jgi:hypothetical protein
MLNFYINRAGKNLSASRKRVLEAAKNRLRHLFRAAARKLSRGAIARRSAAVEENSTRPRFRGVIAGKAAAARMAPSPHRQEPPASPILYPAGMAFGPPRVSKGEP